MGIAKIVSKEINSKKGIYSFIENIIIIEAKRGRLSYGRTKTVFKRFNCISES